jgi:putative sigma-54 modulation protein
MVQFIGIADECVLEESSCRWICLPLKSKVKAGSNKVQLQIRCSGIKNTDELRYHVRRRMGFSLGRLSAAIRAVSIRLMDVNGPRGGCDKLCKVLVRTSSGSSLVVEETNSDLFSAISKAAERVGRLAAGQIGLSHNHRRLQLSDPRFGLLS